MGLLGDIFGFAFGAGAGSCGAHNAHLAELAIKNFSESDKKKVAEKVIKMGVNATGNRLTAAQFRDHFNGAERVYQLNAIALALDEMNICPLNSDGWLEVRNPFALNIDSMDLEVDAHWFLKKHKISVFINKDRININEWEK